MTVFTVCPDTQAFQSALLTTFDNKVYGVGFNKFYQLGLGDDLNRTDAALIQQLSDYNIQYIQLTAQNGTALSEDGQIFRWGANSFGQIGNGNLLDQKVPLKLENPNNVRQIHSSTSHVACVTQEGDLYCWGNNSFGQIGNESMKNQLSPVKVKLPAKAVHVALGEAHTMAILETGIVYSFGRNLEGQLGIGRGTKVKWNTDDGLNWSESMIVNTPVMVDELRDKKIVQISCGDYHSLFLDDKGFVYACGLNSNGQIGNNTNTNQFVPVKLNLENVTTIVCHKNASFAENDDAVYVWGKLNKQVKFLTPMKVKDYLLSIDAVCMQLTNETCRMYELPKILLGEFDNSESYDLKIIVEGKPIYVYKLHLYISDYLKSLLTSKEYHKKKEIHFTDYSYDVYYAYLRFLHTEEISEPEDPMLLFHLAGLTEKVLRNHKSPIEEELRKKCAEMLRNRLTVENVVKFLLLSLEHKTDTVYEVCVKYMLEHLNEVIQTPEFKMLDPVTEKIFMLRVSELGKKEEKKLHDLTPQQETPEVLNEKKEDSEPVQTQNQCVDSENVQISDSKEPISEEIQKN